jgi:hypothetical protein
MTRATHAQVECIIAIKVEAKDFELRTGLRLKLERLPLPDYDFKKAFEEELMMHVPKRRTCRLATPEDGITGLEDSYEGGYRGREVFRLLAKPGLHADIVAFAKIDGFGATQMGRTDYNVGGTIVKWDFRKSRDNFPEFTRNSVGSDSQGTSVHVSGSVAEHQADNQKLMKENILKAIRKWCRMPSGFWVNF